MSTVPKSSIEVHHRASVPRSTAPANESTSIFSTFARSSILQPSIRLSSSCALFEDEFSPLPADSDESSGRLRLRSSNASSLKSSVHSDQSPEKKKSSASSIPPSDQSVEKKSSASSIPQTDQPAEKKSPPPIPQAALSPERKAPPPPPQSAQPVAKQSSRGSEEAKAELSSSYRPPADFLAEIRQKGAERMAKSKSKEAEEPMAQSTLSSQSSQSTQTTRSTRSSQSTRSTPSSSSTHSSQPVSSAPASDTQTAAAAPPSRPLPANFLAEIRKKGAERMAKSKEVEATEPVSATPASHTSETPLKPAESTPAPPARPLPANFLAEIRQKGAERLAKSKEIEAAQPSAPSAPSAPSTTEKTQKTQKAEERPARPLPANFLAEIREKGAARQEALQQKQTRKGSMGTLGSNSSTLGSRSGTIRRNGTLGGGSGSKRYGQFVMHEIRSGQNTLKVCEDGQESQAPKSGGNPLLDEIRNFNLANLRKVDKEKSPKDTPEKKTSQEPSLADLMRSRLECFDSDSNTDSDDSRFDFSD